jgi:hypothetical protein
MAVRFAEVARPYFTPADGPQTPLVAALGAGCLVAAAITSPDAVGRGPVLCPFRLVTGLPCPGCGLTRSWVYLAHGRWADALAANPFGVVAMTAVLVLLVTVAVRLAQSRPLPSLSAALASPGFRIVASLWLVFGVTRLALALT